MSFSQALDTPQEVDELGYCRAVVLAAQEPECVQVSRQLSKVAKKMWTTVREKSNSDPASGLIIYFVAFYDRCGVAIFVTRILMARIDIVW